MAAWSLHDLVDGVITSTENRRVDDPDTTIRTRLFVYSFQYCNILVGGTVIELKRSIAIDRLDATCIDDADVFVWSLRPRISDDPVGTSPVCE